MRIRPFIYSLIILCAFTACKDNSPETSAKDAAARIELSVVTMPETSQRYEGLPLVLTQALTSLEFGVNPSELKIIGGRPEAKINLYNVAAYAEYPEGWLLASGYGEWGGVIFWVDKNGGYEIIRDDDRSHPVDMIADGNTLLVSQGMGRGEVSNSHLLEINRRNGAFETHVYPMAQYPQKFEKYDGEWIIPVGRDQKYFVVSELRAGKTQMHDRD